MGGISLRSNIAAARAQRQLAEANAGFARALERLSSGQRINRASDDAAGLAISSGLRKDSRVYTQAVRNANDAISGLSIAQGALGELSSVGIRLRELAVQAANGSLARTQRLSLDNEAKELVGEFNRIVSSTSFNGLNLMSGTMGTMRVQMGYGTSGSIGIELGAGLSRNLGTGYDTSTTVAFAGGDLTNGLYQADFNEDGRADFLTANTDLGTAEVYRGTSTSTLALTQSLGSGITIAGTGDFSGDGRADVVASDGSSLFVYTNSGNATFGAALATTFSGATRLEIGDINGDGRSDVVAQTAAGVSVLFAQSDGRLAFKNSFTAAGTISDIGIGDLNGDGKGDVVLGNSTNGRVDIFLGSAQGVATSAVTNLISLTPGRIDVVDINYDGLADVVTAGALIGTSRVLKSKGDGTLQLAQTLTTGTNADIKIKDTDGDGIPDLVFGEVGQARIFKGRGDATFDNATTKTITGGTSSIALGDLDADGVVDILAENNTLPGPLVALFSTTTSSTTAARVNLTSRAGALEAIATIDAILSRIQSETGNIGAAESRVNAGLNALAAIREHSEQAASRITDADVASEAATQARLKILQDAGAAVLQSANLQPKIALTLLGA